jgi:rare lipoprotein A
MVTNLENGRAVEVRINDRGPFVGGRAIDLSYAAARSIAMIGPGTARVRVEVLGHDVPTREALARETPDREAIARASRPPPQPPPHLMPAPPGETPLGSYLVEVGALSDPTKAEHLRQVLARRFPNTFVSPLAGGTGRYYRVRLGPYPLRGAAVAHAEQVARLGYPAILVDESGP